MTTPLTLEAADLHHQGGRPSQRRQVPHPPPARLMHLRRAVDLTNGAYSKGLTPSESNFSTLLGTLPGSCAVSRSSLSPPQPQVS